MMGMIKRFIKTFFESIWGMYDAFERWYTSWFTILTYEEVCKRKLTYIRNIYGDEINAINCRSLWKDEYDNVYRCESLKNNYNV